MVYATRHAAWFILHGLCTLVCYVVPDLDQGYLSKASGFRYELLRIRAAVQDPERDEEITKRVNDCFQRFIAARSRGEVQIRVVTPPVMLLGASPCA